MARFFCQVIEGAGDEGQQKAKSVDATTDEAFGIVMEGGYSGKGRERCESEQHTCSVCKTVDQFLMTGVTLHTCKIYQGW